MTSFASVPHSDPAGFRNQSIMLSADGATKNPLALPGVPDYMSSAFPTTNDFQSYNIDYHSLFSIKNGRGSPSGKLAGDTNTYGGVYDNVKFDNNFPMSNACASMYSSLYQSNNLPGGNGASDLTFAFNQMDGSLYPQMDNYPQMGRPSKPLQLGLTDLESLQQKVSQKKQTLDILQGVMPDPLEVNQEKRYMTNTERIQVPSSDHVAEIVGKNGQRIKQLREQLKVWVKTPSRDEPPIFEVTGLPEKLAEAKAIILRMSEHFTKVQQERHQRSESNRIEDRLYVEQDKVGLIVGASGQTIRWVQHLSDTHIATPRKQESIPGLPPPQTFFTICGSPDKVKFAKQLICEYVTLRCQGLWLDPDLDPSQEAARLVREFHQRRQSEDAPRKPSAGDAAIAGGARGLPHPQQAHVGPAMDSSCAFPVPPPMLPPMQQSGAMSGCSMRQLISDMDDMWSRGPALGLPAVEEVQQQQQQQQQQPVWSTLPWSAPPPAPDESARDCQRNGGGGGGDSPALVGPGWM